MFQQIKALLRNPQLRQQIKAATTLEGMTSIFHGFRVKYSPFSLTSARSLRSKTYDSKI